MANPMLTPHDKWQSFRCDCVYQNGIQLAGKHEAMCDIPMGYLTGKKLPNYPVPALIGPVIHSYEPCGRILELIVTDCDDAADPRLCIAVLGYRGNEVITDYPHDSPNYR